MTPMPRRLLHHLHSVFFYSDGDFKIFFDSGDDFKIFFILMMMVLIVYWLLIGMPVRLL
jgi:hypothetical protein